MNRWILVFGILVMGISTSQAVTLEEGNAAYEKGQYDGALDIYLQLTRQGFQGSELFYNIGNAYYQKGDRGRAILWYERALRLSPRDSDIDFNLSLARSHLKDAQRPVWERILFFFSDKELGFFVLAMIWATFGLLFWQTIRPQRDNQIFSAGLGTSVILLVISALWFGVRSWQQSVPRAIVTAPPGEVRNGPGVEYPVGFTVPEGTGVLVLSERGKWRQVGVPEQGLKGWMPENELEAITSQNFF